ncbi:MAG: hypothetical protein KF819_05145 [Labilithrix sp.]|nr:hypothetical protein [Labilithrix sp.]
MSRASTAIVAGVLLSLGACGLDIVGTRAPDEGAVPATDAGADVVDGTAPSDAAFDASLATSCADVLARDPSRLQQSGVYEIDPAGLRGRLRVYCEMSIDGGGWTLVGRSSPNAGGAPFGWSSTSGSVTDLRAPYSLGVANSGLAFSEVLLAGRGPASLDVGARAFKLAVSPTFLTAHASTVVLTGVVTSLRGDCAPSGGPTMLKYAGATSMNDAFFFRDIQDTNQHRGLQRDGWDLYYDNCPQGASLNREQGLVFVR